MKFSYHPNINGDVYGEREIPYKGKLIIEYDSGYVKAYAYDEYHKCHCLLMFADYMTVEEAKAKIDKEVE